MLESCSIYLPLLLLIGSGGTTLASEAFQDSQELLECSKLEVLSRTFTPTMPTDQLPLLRQELHPRIGSGFFTSFESGLPQALLA
ncbi:hypothetical protein EMIT0P100_10999 [Pseudomonas sp. IT-P100]